ncbi:MAG: YiaA/YiaB family inner membrane protein [Pseudonocardia sp.]
MNNTTRATTQTTAFEVQAALSFTVSLVAIGLAIIYLPGDPWIRGVLAIGVLYAVTSAFTLSKTVRDRQESSSVMSRVDRARLERLLADHDPFKSDV